MIRLVKVGFVRQNFPDRSEILRDCTASFPPLSRTAIIGRPSSGKTTLAKILQGKDRPSSGRVERSSGITAPLGFTANFNPHLSARLNVLMLADLLDFDPWAVLDATMSFSGLSSKSEETFGRFSPMERARIGFAFSYATPEAFLLADEMTGGGDIQFRQLCDGALRFRLRKSGLIFLVRNARAALPFCDRFYALVDGRLVDCGTADNAERVSRLDHVHHAEEFLDA